LATMASTALLFDLDGTLWDSRGFYAKAISLAGGDFNASMLYLMDGIPVARLLREAGISRLGFFGFVAKAKVDIRLYPNVLSVLHKKNAKGVPMGIVTNLPGWIAEPMLDITGLSQFFSTVVDWGRCRTAKPYPKPLLIALEDLNVVPSRNVWYVGDSVADGQAASAANISFAWASYGYGPKTFDGTDKVLKSFSEILEL
jgi:phosphoglycolate phosphatase-like HAD superfamily hydrolase